MAWIGPEERQRLLLSLLLGVCLTVMAANLSGMFRGASITPLLSDTANLPGMLFASVCGSPTGGERVGFWRAMFYLGDLLAYTFFVYIALSVGGARTRRR